MLNKIKAVKTYLNDLCREYRDRYSLLYPHGILRKIIRKYPQYSSVQVFIETGTFKGKTARIESRYFKKVHTIELNKDLYQNNLAVFAEFPNIKSYCGDSAEVLPEILKKLNESCLIFLDAHWSGDSSVDWSDSAWQGYGMDTSFRGEKWPPDPEQQCPLIDEARVIGEFVKNSAVVVIDDWSSVGTKDHAFQGEDWSAISLDKILNALGREKILKYFTTRYKDKVRMIILLK